MTQSTTLAMLSRSLPAGLLLGLALVLAACTQPGAPEVVVTPSPAPTSTPPPTEAPATQIAPAESPAALPPATTPATTSATVTPTPQPVFDPDRIAIGPQKVISGLTQPVFLTHAGDGSQRLFVVERPGRIWLFGPELGSPTLFLDIRERVGSRAPEQGLLGLAFPPNFSQTGHFFVNYTDRQGDTHIARFTVSRADPNQADPASEFPVLGLDQPAANHNGGMLAFGPDGMLYVGTGDGGAANDKFGNGQNPATLLGKMLRLDVTSDPRQPYTVPADNPWVTATWNGQEVRDEIWALGLRNPWRYSFDRRTGDLWIGDVGQTAWEEIDYVNWASQSRGGLNFGWPIMEGNHCFQRADCDPSGLALPVAEYGHQEGNCSVTGGYVYRGAAYPVLDGVYFYGDFCSGFLWALWRDETGAFQSQRVLATGLSISSFGEDEQGELYLLDYGGGAVYQLQAAR